MLDDPLPESSGIPNEQVNIQGSSKTYNVFEVLSNGRRTLILYLGDPIERGQSVKLQFLQLQRFDNSRVSNVGGDKTLQNLIQERLRNLPVPLLLQSLKFLKTIEILPLFLHILSFCTSTPTSTSCKFHRMLMQ